MNELVLSLLSSTTAGTAAAGLLVWLAKSWISEHTKSSIKHEYDMRAEAYKVNMKREADVEMERLRSTLSEAATEHSVRFAHLHVKRAEVIAETYELLADFVFAAQDYTKMFEPAGGTSKEERLAALSGAGESFYQHYRAKRLWLPKASAEKVKQIHDRLHRSTYLFVYAVHHAQEGYRREQLEAWKQVSETIQEISTEAMDELEREFRVALGDSSREEPA